MLQLVRSVPFAILTLLSQQAAAFQEALPTDGSPALSADMVVEGTVLGYRCVDTWVPATELDVEVDRAFKGAEHVRDGRLQVLAMGCQGSEFSPPHELHTFVGQHVVIFAVNKAGSNTISSWNWGLYARHEDGTAVQGTSRIPAVYGREADSPYAESPLVGMPWDELTDAVARDAALHPTPYSVFIDRPALSD
ncbi:MAG: hypothetical protein ACI9K5_003601 [Gammaproteobacteria bacterium]|jgi:hypothetical protein